MPANIQEMLIGFGKCKQAALATANTVTGIWRLGKLNADFGGPKLNTENDADELGKGNEFATQLFKTSWDVAGKLEKYASAEFAAWVMAFGLGKVVKTGTTPNWIYTCTPLNPVTDGIELPCFSYLEQIRPGAAAVIDRMMIGCVIEDWTLTVGSGPGRANSKLAVSFVGSGKHLQPSGITLPAATAELLLPSASLTATINGTDYVTAKNLVSLEASWKNNHRMDSGFYPGSGLQGAMAQVEVITLTGSGGTATVAEAGGLSKVATWGTDLSTTAAAFVSSWAAAYTGVGITITSLGPTVIFTAAVPGTGFTAPTITNLTTDLAGTVAHIAPNIASGGTGAIRGRLEVGKREAGLKFTARFAYGSEELNKLLALTEGTAVITLTYDSNSTLSLTFQRVTFEVAEPNDTDGLVTVQVTCLPMWHSSNGLLTAVAKCIIDGIAQPES
jgi:hypothetical protein